METELLTARITDTAGICERTSKPKFLGFLSPEEAVLAQRLLKNNACRTEYFGGFKDASRVMLGCFPDWQEESVFPISALSFRYRVSDELGHRDFLGSLMALGIKRETVGDILIEPGRAVVFVTDDIKEYVKTQVSKIGGTGVTVTEGFDYPLPEGDRLAEFSVTAASDRLDCVISALCGFSRAKAADAVNDGLITVNSAPALKVTKSLFSGDIITVRGKGKFIIDSLDGRSKKNRIIIKYRKYI